MNDNILLTATAITKHFGGRKVLDNVGLQIRQGQILTLIGPNGAGKTTLIRIALGLMQPDGGEITQQHGLRIGYMPQRMQLDPVLPLTVSRFLRLGHASGTADMQQVLERLHIPHLSQQQLRDISGGELQRVLLARALIRDPHLLILDEPAQGVDVAGQSELYRLIDELSSAQGCSVLMISHDLHLVMSSTDEVICLNHHVCCHGKPEQVSNDPAFLDLFGAQASGSFAVYTHRHTHTHDLAGEVISQQDSNGD
ncbi:MAG: zinc ABC transporter ATP-binding protein ZnuC [Pseudohongiellaceae bacterium]